MLHSHFIRLFFCFFFLFIGEKLLLCLDSCMKLKNLSNLLLKNRAEDFIGSSLKIFPIYMCIVHNIVADIYIYQPPIAV